MDAFNFTVSAWTINVQEETIANYFWHFKICSGDEAVSKTLNEATSKEGIHELEKMINDLGYRNKMDVNHILDYPGENDEYLKVQSLEELMASVLENLVEDEAKDDSVPLELIT